MLITYFTYKFYLLITYFRALQAAMEASGSNVYVWLMQVMTWLQLHATRSKRPRHQAWSLVVWTRVAVVIGTLVLLVYGKPWAVSFTIWVCYTTSAQLYSCNLGNGFHENISSKCNDK